MVLNAASASGAEPVGALVVGGGPSGLMAAEMLGRAGVDTIVAEAMPTVGRKLLMAGKAGLNLTKEEPAERFAATYGAMRLMPPLAEFGPQEVRRWTEELGQDTFVGSTGRVFPRAMKASPLLRAWLARLAALGVEVRTSWRWTGDLAAPTFQSPAGVRVIAPRAVVLALGGASWRRLGSDGAWAPRLAEQEVPVAPFSASNAGIEVAWSDKMTRHFGAPLKAVRFRAGERESRGEAVISARGLEGGGLYPLTPALRGNAALTVDLVPDLSTEAVAARLTRPRGKATFSAYLRRVLRLDPVRLALLHEFGRPLPGGLRLAALVKALPVTYSGLRPMDEAISTAGGVRWSGIDDQLMLKARPGVFVAGEMIDWEAPTGGYLITACFATGRQAGLAAAAWALSDASSSQDGSASAR